LLFSVSDSLQCLLTAMKEVKQILDLLHLERWSDNLISKINIRLVSSRKKIVFTLSLNLQLSLHIAF